MGRPSLVFLVVAALVLPCLAIFPTAASPGDVGPLVDKPSGDGSYLVGYFSGSIDTTTKAYNTNVKVYYPATTAGSGTTADTSGAPYPTIVWLPGYGGNEGHYGPMLTRMSTWGMVVMAVGVNWDDFPYSANSTDMNDFLDWLENENVTPASHLYTMVDEEGFGLSGHSSGGGLSLADGAVVDRIKAVQPFAAAIASSSIDGLAARWGSKPLLLQTGQDDSNYIEGSRKSYEKIGPPNSLWETIGAGHGGPWQEHLLPAFYLYYLNGQTEYEPLIYGKEAVDEVVAGRVDMKFKQNETHFFPPEVSASVSPKNVFMDEVVNFTGTAVGYTGHPSGEFQWDVDGDGAADFTSATETDTVHTYSEPGFYTASFKYRLGPKVYQIPEDISIFVQNVAPVAVAGADLAAEEDAVVSFDGSASYDTISDNSSLEYMWTFGDGGEEDWKSSPLATHTYEDEGSYTVTLTVRDTHEDSSTDTLKVTVSNVVPTVDAGADMTGLEDELIIFAGSGSDTVSDVTDLTFKWDFGDGNASDWDKVPEAIHAFRAKGTYVATLTVKDDNGAEATDTIDVTIYNPAPSVGITSPEDGAEFNEDDEVELIGWGDDTLSDAPSLMYSWDLGDGTVTEWGLDASYLHVYEEAGTYTVTLSVEDDDGNVTTASVDIEVVNPAPTAEIVLPVGDLTVNEDEVIGFEGVGSDTASDEDGLVYTWTVGTETYSGTEVDLAFSKTGIYDVVLSVTDDDGAEATDTVQVTVKNVAPKVDASVSRERIYEGESIEFNATVDDTPSDEAAGLTVSWDFGDGTTSSNLSGSHEYDIAKDYTVTVTVVDNDGAEAEETFTVHVLVLKESKPIDGPEPDEGLGMLVIAGIGVLIAVVIVTVLLLLIMRSRRMREAPPPPPPMGAPPGSEPPPPSEGGWPEDGGMVDDGGPPDADGGMEETPSGPGEGEIYDGPPPLPEERPSE